MAFIIPVVEHFVPVGRMVIIYIPLFILFPELGQ